MFESYWQIFLIAFAGSLISTGLILTLIWFIIKKNRNNIISYINLKIEERLKEERVRFGSQIEDRVSTGVTKGIHEGVSSLPSTEVLKRTRQTMAKTGRDIMGSGIQSLLGKRQD